MWWERICIPTQAAVERVLDEERRKGRTAYETQTTLSRGHCGDDAGGVQTCRSAATVHRSDNRWAEFGTEPVLVGKLPGAGLAGRTGGADLPGDHHRQHIANARGWSSEPARGAAGDPERRAGPVPSHSFAADQ